MHRKKFATLPAGAGPVRGRYSGMPDYIPERDVEFQAWLRNFAAQAAALAGSLPLSAQQQAAIQEVKTVASEAYTAHLEAHAVAKTARQRKDQTQADATQVIRGIARLLQAEPSLTDEHRKALRLPVRDRVRTRQTAPPTAPLVMIDASQRLEHRLVICDPVRGNRRSKPPGAMGCEVWMDLAPPQTAEGEPGRGGEGEKQQGQAVGTSPEQQPMNGETVLLGITTNSRFEHRFDAPHASWTARYRLRWFSRRGDKGPWSEPVAATIAG